MRLALLAVVIGGSVSWGVAGAAAAQEQEGVTAETTGARTVSFAERSPLSVVADIGKRMGWSPAMMRQPLPNEGPREMEYELSGESFEVLVPKNYTGAKAFGLLVFVNAGPGGRMARGEWAAVLERHELIYVGPNKAGNSRAVWVRMGLVMDAAHNMKKQYKIDERRVYVAGGSGGGRTASLLGIGFPDVFTGGFYMIGCNFYRDLPSVEQAPAKFRKTFSPPPGKLFDLTKQRTRHVLLTGETDGNREQTKVNAEAMRRDGFRHVTYFEVPGMGHQAPNTEWFEKGIVELDKGLSDAVGPATRGTTRPATRAAAIAERSPGERLLAMAKVYVQNKRYAEARGRLEKIVAEYPGTGEAEEARGLLTEIEGK